jgi:flagellar basal body rod protein FlgF
MAQHDYNLANQSGADFRADLNNALSAIVTVNSGATAPSTTFAHQLWVDTSSSVLKIRNSANDAWVTTGVSITADNTFTGNLTSQVMLQEILQVMLIQLQLLKLLEQ